MIPPVRQAPFDTSFALDVVEVDALGWGVGVVDAAPDSHNRSAAHGQKARVQTENGQAGLAQTVRVKGVLAGERVEVRVVRREGRTLIAELVAVLQPDRARVVPRCPHFSVCGGCSWQHLDALQRVARNAESIAQQLTQAGINAPAAAAPVLSPTYHYRRRARLSARYTQRGNRLHFGFREAASRHVADIETCAVIAEPFASALPSLQVALGELSIRHAIPEIECAAGDDSAAVVVRHLQSLTQGDQRVLRQWEARSGIHVWLQAGGPETTVRLQPESPEWLHYRVADDAPHMAFHPLDFVQVNAHVNRAMVGLALAALRKQGAQRVLDLFCGIGNFTLPIAAAIDRVVGVESAPELVRRAQMNARQNNLARVQFVSLDLHTHASRRLADLGGFDTVLLDPPRAGAGAALAVLPKLGANHLLYVSCNPVTFVSDVQALAANGYQLQEWRVLDMFPHTQHVECMGTLERI